MIIYFHRRSHLAYCPATSFIQLATMAGQSANLLHHGAVASY